MASNGYSNDLNGHSNGVNGETGPSPRPRKQLGTIGPDGFPILPPIRKPAKPKEDPYAKSKLMTYRLATENKSLLMKILHESAMKASEDTHYFNEITPAEEEENPFPDYPPEMMSKNAEYG